MSPGDLLRRTALAGSVAIACVAGAMTPASAQVPLDFEPDYFKSELTEYEIEISGTDFVIFDVFQQNYPDGENEQVRIEFGDASAQISFFDDSDSPEDTVELWLDDLGSSMDSLEVIDRGEDDDVVWAYAEGEYEGRVLGYYVRVTEDVHDNVDILESVLTLDGEVVSMVDAAQQEITVNGESFMGNVDLDDLETLVGGEDENDPDPDRDEDDDGDPDATQEAGFKGL